MSPTPDPKLQALSKTVRDYVTGGGVVKMQDKHVRQRMEERGIDEADIIYALARGRATDYGKGPNRVVWQGRNADGQPIKLVITPPAPIHVITVMDIAKGWFQQ